ncbi:MAG: nucleoside 2-deoxyribosyltransferase [Candidatus Nanoarchaeia archaeon]
MKAYITCAVTHNKDKLNLLPKIEEVVKAKGIKTFVIEEGGNAEEIFKRDYEQLKNSNLMIAEISEPSIGVGIELGLSYSLGIKRILLLEKGKKLTKIARGMPETKIIEYENVDELTEKLSFVLQNSKKNV